MTTNPTPTGPADMHDVEEVRRTVEQMATVVDRVAHGLAEHIEAGHPERVAAVSWLTLPDDPDRARQVLGELGNWLTAVYLRYGDGARSLPACWMWHPDVVEELLWLMHAWLLAYQSDAATVQLAGDWHDRYRPGVVRRIKEAAGKCSLEQHCARPGHNPPASAPAPLDGLDAIAEWWGTHRAAPAPEPTTEQCAAATPTVARRR